ncbi:MAG: PQQ-binding-like beta-propeller repeat protein [Planctomycetota bacterium]
MKLLLSLQMVVAIVATTGSATDDWPRFRGPSGTGVAEDSAQLPSHWSPTSNISWKSPLPGPGASSPIIIGKKVFVTCYSGYGLKTKDPGDIENLIRHLVCFDLETGQQLWQRTVKAVLPEDPYDKSGVSSHGYASHTPVSDGKAVYCFFGKSGVHAFDLDGNPLWSTDVGSGSDPPRWGSSSSPVLHQSTVIVTASAESQSIIGLDKVTGRKLWQTKSKALDGMWGTPTLVEISPSRSDLVMMVAGELWGINPEDGQFRWRTKATDSKQAYTSVIAQDKRVFAFSGSGGGGVAIDIGEKDPSTVDVAWRTNVFATYASPVQVNGRIYIVSRGILSVVDATTGERLERLRIKGARQIGNERFGSLDYASPVVVGQRLFWLNASGQMYVFELGKVTKQIAVNELTDEREIFWGSPAVSQGRMVVRSSAFLYCITQTQKKQ